MLRKIIRTPTESIRTRDERRLQITAAIGAAITPPIIRPSIISNWTDRINKTNVTASLAVTKNSVVLTVPMDMRGLCPLATNVEVTIGPHPPPPIASQKPPTPARGMGWIFFIEIVGCLVFRRIRTPIIMR